MKKKYSTLLSFALATCVATALVACAQGRITKTDYADDGKTVKSQTVIEAKSGTKASISNDGIATVDASKKDPANALVETLIPALNAAVPAK